MLAKFLINTSSCLSNICRKKKREIHMKGDFSKQCFRLSFFVHWVYSFLAMHKKPNFFRWLQLSAVGQVIREFRFFHTKFKLSAFLSMIILCIIHLAKRSSSEHPTPVHPAVFHFRSLPPLFGICVYSFVCILFLFRLHPSLDLNCFRCVIIPFLV